MLDESIFMRRCIELALNAEGRTAPNPLVGSLVVDDQGNILGAGYHHQAGLPHAEIEALDQAGDTARGQTLFVNLEPCAHQGRTPPCTKRVIAAGVKQVVIGIEDPNPKVSGQGIRELKAAGLNISTGVLNADCRYLNRGFLTWINKGRPWVTLKMAMTLDGRIADRKGKSRWISGLEARQFVMELRNKYDCVLIGGRTAILDDPELTVRDLPKGRNPKRAIIDQHLKIPKDARLCANTDGNTRIFTSVNALAEHNLPPHVQLKTVDQVGAHLDLSAVLKQLAIEGVLTVLCEGGAKLAAAMLELDLIDEIAWIIAPKLLTDGLATPVLSGDRIVDLNNALNLKSTAIKQLGNDLLVTGLLHQP